MVKLRSHDDDLKGKGVDTGDPIEERFAKWEELNDQRFSRLEERLEKRSDKRFSELKEMIAALGMSGKFNQADQRESLTKPRVFEYGEDHSTVDPRSTPSMKARGGGSDHFKKLRDDRRLGGGNRRFGDGQFREGANDDDETYGISAEFRDYLMLRNDDDDETWTWTEHYSVMDDETDLLEEESMPHFQVPVSDLEHGLRIHNASSIVCEDSQYVVGCDELCDHQKSTLQVSYVKEVEELPQKSTSGNGEHVAHQLFDQKPVRVSHKEKHMKHLKAWKFKFKSTSKRSRLMDDEFSFVDATVLLNKDPQEIIWECVNKEFKETLAGCGRKRVERFKLAEEKESRLEVLDLNQTLMYHQIGHGFDTLFVLKRIVHDKEMVVVRQRATSLMICDCSNRSSRANRVWKPGGLVCVQDHSGGSILMRTQRFQGLHLQGIIYMDMKFQEVIVDNVETGSKGLAYDGCVILGMNFAGFEIGEAELLVTSQKMQRIDLFSFCCSCTNQIFVAIHTEIEENLEFNQLLAALERFSREVIEELAERIVIEQKIEGGLICGGVKFHLQHKWRFRLFQSFSRLVLLALINLWLSKTHAFSGQLQDLRRVLTASSFEGRKKKLGSKTWMFKYKVPHLDDKIFETSDQCIRKRGLVSDDQETEDNQLILRSFMWVIQNCLNQYMVLLLASDAYDAQFSGGVGMAKKQSHLSLWINRVWDPGQSLVKDASYSIRMFSSLPATVPVSLLCQESFAYQITPFSTNLEVKVSLKGEDLIQDKRREEWHVWHVRKKQIMGQVGEADWPEKKK